LTTPTDQAADDGDVADYCPVLGRDRCVVRQWPAASPVVLASHRPMAE